MKILGKVPSKSNCYKIITISGHASLGKTKGLKDYEKSFYIQCSERNRNINGFFELRVKVFHENMRPDLDNSLKIILDCLQACKVIKNDRNCVKIVAEKYVDKNEPRIEIELTEV
ncbi:RusA family crossover junction endodeoxyribonuclease [Bacteroides sp.]|uniref:RusA family crossover junction endodeoxyribonuclease n=1 Tax=Bacteroides sp. TaxID=29523 RepID=UPI003FA57203